MQVQILKTFSDPSTPIPFTEQELVTVPDSKAEQWIAQGLAIRFKPFDPSPAPNPAPARRQREKAVRG